MTTERHGSGGDGMAGEDRDRRTTVPPVQQQRDEAGLPADDARGPVEAPGGHWVVRHRYWLLAGVVTALVTIQTLNGQWSTDMWEHVAVVRELIAEPVDPQHPQVLSDATHPGFSPYTVVLGVIGGVLDLSALTVLSVAAVVNVVLLLVALRALVVEATANQRAPFWALMFVLLLWGLRPYRYSGFYNLNSIGFVAPYPSTFATAVAFATLVAALRYARSGRTACLVTIAVGTAIVVLVHPLSAPWFGVALLAVGARLWPDRAHLAKYVAAGVAGLALCLLWPYFSVVDLVRDSSELEALNEAMYSGVLLRIFPVLLGLVVVARRWRADRLDPLALWLAGSSVLYAIGAVTDNTSFGRSLAFLVVVLATALADGVGRLEADPARRGASARWSALALAGLLVLGLITTRGGLVRMVPEPLLPVSLRDSDELVRPDERYAFLEDLVGDTDVVIGARPSDDRVVPAIAGRALSLGVVRPFVDDADARLRARAAFFDPATSAAERAEIVERYSADFALLHRGNPANEQVLDQLVEDGATIVHDDDGLVLVEL
jgi:hypothetical protein